MTGLRDKRKAVEAPLVRRPARSKRAAEVPARRIKRTREPAPTRRRRPPPPVAGDDSTTISYVLRNRLVVVPCTGSPTVSHYEETEEEPEYAPSRQTVTCAQMGLEHYNSVNQEYPKSLVVVECVLGKLCILLMVAIGMRNLLMTRLPIKVVFSLSRIVALVYGTCIVSLTKFSIELHSAFTSRE